MKPKHLVVVLAFLALALPASPAHAGGVVNVCDEAHLLAALVGGGAVTFNCSGTIILTSTITIADDTTIDGSGQSITISGNHAVRVFTVNSESALGLNKLTVAKGNNASMGGAILNYGELTVSNSTFSGNSVPSGPGGGIANYGGTLTVSKSTFSGNQADAGGGIFTFDGTLTVSSSTFSGNSSIGYQGGGISNLGGTLTVSSSTFSGNSSTGSQGGGGGIANANSGTLTVSNSTFSGNSGSGIFNYYGTVTASNCTFAGNSGIGSQGGGGIYSRVGSSDAVTLRNTIVANSGGGKNCYGTIIDGGGNVSYPDTTCPGINADPKLGPLQYNGGPTHTMALLPSSGALDAANDAICAAPPVNSLDQRGFSRPAGPHCDIGAYEAGGIEALAHVYLPLIAR